MNCHTELINILLDHGANINQLTDEGLSALLACHILLYTEQNFVENIAEQIASENLFNATDIERRTGAVLNRNDRKMIMAIYEEIHKPFMSVKKTAKPTLTKKNSSKKRFSVPPQQNNNNDFDQHSGRSSFCNTGASPNFSETEGVREQSSEVLWKVDFYKKSMDHVKDVEVINESFKKVMMDPHACYNLMMQARQQSCQTSDTLTSCDGDFATYNGYVCPSSDVTNQTVNKDCQQKEKKQSKFFSTTLVSNFGYNLTSALHTVKDQKKRKNELVLELLNNERYCSFRP